jgi:chromosome segregation ATPase
MSSYLLNHKFSVLQGDKETSINQNQAAINITEEKYIKLENEKMELVHLLDLKTKQYEKEKINKFIFESQVENYKKEVSEYTIKLELVGEELIKKKKEIEILSIMLHNERSKKESKLFTTETKNNFQFDKEEIRKKEEKISEYKTKFQEVTVKLMKSTEYIENLEKAFEDLKLQFGEKCLNLEQIQEKYLKETMENKMLRKSLENIKSNVEKLDGENRQFNEIIKSKESEKNLIQNSLEEKINENSQLINCLQKMQLTHSNLFKTHNILEKENTNFNHSLESLCKEMNQLKHENAKLKNCIGELETKIVLLQNDKIVINNWVSAASEELFSRNQIQNQLSPKENVDSSNKIKSQNKEIEYLKKEIKELKEKILNLKQVNDNEPKILEKYIYIKGDKNHVNQVDDKFIKLSQELAYFKNYIERIEKEKHDLTLEIENLRIKYNSIQTDNFNKEVKLHTLEKSLIEANQEIVSQKLASANIQEDKLNYSSQLKQSEEAFKLRENETKSVLILNNKFKEISTNKDTTINNLQRELFTFNLTIKEKDKIIADLSENLSKVIKELNNLKTENEKLKTKLIKLKTNANSVY